MSNYPPTVGVIGLGMMGSGIAKSLIAANFDCVVTDLRSEIADTEPAFGERWRFTPEEIAQSADIVFVVVVDATQAEVVMFGLNGIAQGDHEGLVVCLCSTVEIAEVERLASLATPFRFELLDVGIAGGPDAAASGSLLTTIGGSPSVLDQARAALEAISVRVMYGGTLGADMSLKLLKNALSFSVMSAVHEVVLLGEQLGISSEVLAAVAKDTNLVDHFFWFPMARPSALPLDGSDERAVTSATHFAGIARKDVSAAIEVADRVGVDHRVLDLTRDRADEYFLLPATAKD